MAKSISKDTPLAEITLRKYETPSNFKGRDLVRKLCLSLGLLQPGDSRDIMVDVFGTVLESKEIKAKDVVNKVILYRKKHKQKLLGVAPSNIRRQLRRLKDLQIIEKVENTYRLNQKDSLATIFEERITKFYLDDIVKRVKEYTELF